MPDDYLNAAEAAQALHTHEKIIRQWIREKKIKATHPGRDWRIPRSEIARLQKVLQIDDPVAALEGRLSSRIENLRRDLESQIATLRRELEEMAARNAPQPQRYEAERAFLPQPIGRPDPQTPQAQRIRPLPARFSTIRQAQDFLLKHQADRALLLAWRDLSMTTPARTLEQALARQMRLAPCDTPACPCQRLLKASG